MALIPMGTTDKDKDTKKKVKPHRSMSVSHYTGAASVRAFSVPTGANSTRPGPASTVSLMALHTRSRGAPDRNEVPVVLEGPVV